MKNRNSFGCWLFVISYWLLVNHGPYSMFHLPNSAAAVDKKTSQSRLADTTDPNSHFNRQLWLAKLDMAEGEKDKITKNELRRIIEQIRSVNFGPRKEAFETAIVPDVMPKDGPDEPNEPDEPDEAVSEDAKEQNKMVKESSLPYGLVTNQTLQTIRKLSLKPGNLHNPFELGETLFLSGYLKEAAIFYKQALKRKSPDDAGSAQDRAWILFQIGNCLRNDEQSEAIKMYGQLITEYPNSPWKELADARRTLLNWYLKNEPRKLIAERKR
ncbi:MAG: tetratricopeptide repeat protein [Planctomycetota bacterium]|jgi:tetratricopeptide (TPR) repeat protein